MKRVLILTVLLLLCVTGAMAETGDFVVTGGTGSFADDVLTINQSGLTVGMAGGSNTPTTQRIVIDGSGSKFSKNAPLVVTLNGLNIATSGVNNAPVSVEGYVKIILQGKNTLDASNAENAAGLQQNGVTVAVDMENCKATTTNGCLILDGNGSLSATGGFYAAGIGGGFLGDANVEIGGNVVIEKAKGGIDGAGIGGGYSVIESKGSNAYVKIGGNAEIKMAQGGHQSAGIGGSYNSQRGSSAYVVIGGNSKVTAVGGSYAAGIGGGEGVVHDDDSIISGSNAYVEIADDCVVKVNNGDEMGAGIGGACNYEVVKVLISGGTITASSGAVGIGGGAGNKKCSREVKVEINGGNVTAKSNHMNAVGAGGSAGYSPENVKVFVEGVDQTKQLDGKEFFKIEILKKILEAGVASMPQTGDPSSLMGWAALLLASAAGMKKTKKQK